MTEEERFKAYTKYNPENGCIEWQGSLNRWGYGSIKINKIKTPVHRYSYKTYKGPIPDGLFVCHSCDNPSCVNPDHLFLGTPQDNTNDMVSKGRQCKGSQKHCAKLTEETVRQIIKDNNAGIPLINLPKKYSISLDIIYAIMNGKIWKHVDEPIIKQPKNSNIGEKCPTAKLTRDQVIALYNEYKNSSISIGTLAVKYGISFAQTKRILKGERWAHLKLDPIEIK